MLTRFRFGLAVLALHALSATSTFAQGPLLESYTAFLGPDDHFNSRGARLTEPWQIVRQDRANFHRFGIRDAGDQGDTFFASAGNRARMERMIMNGRINPAAAARIINGNVWIRVDIFENAVNVTVE